MARNVGALMLLALALALGPRAGGAGPAEPDRESPADPWQSYPAREVERPILPAAGGMVTSLDIRSLSATQALDEDGKAVDTDGRYNLLDLELKIAYGITDRVEISAGIPYLTGEIGETKGGGIGDVFAGLRVGLVKTGGPADVTAGVRVSYPLSSAKYNFELLGKDLVLQNFRTNDPSFDFYPEIEGRFRAGGFSLRARLTGIITNPGEVNFSIIPGDTKRVNADPGDGYEAETGFYYQATDRLVPGVFLQYTSVSETKIDGDGLSDGVRRLEIQPRLMWQQSPEAEIMIGAGYVVEGKNTPLGYPVIIQVNARF